MTENITITFAMIATHVKAEIDRAKEERRPAPDAVMIPQSYAQELEFDLVKLGKDNEVLPGSWEIHGIPVVFGTSKGVEFIYYPNYRKRG